VGVLDIPSPIKIVHLTTAHPRFDSRIYYKQCHSLMFHGYDVTLIVADGQGDQHIDGIIIKDIGGYAQRAKRILLSPFKAYSVVKQVAPRIVHIHDPELLFTGLLLKIFGMSVVYDAHEDLPEQIKRKFWIPRYFRPVVSWLSKQLLRFILYFYDAVVVATDGISAKISHKKVVTVKNYPILAEFTQDKPIVKEIGQFCYAGLMSEDRGLFTMVTALPKDRAMLVLAGIFHQKSLKEKFFKQAIKRNINFLGFLSRKEIADVYSSSVGGLVVLHSDCGYEETLPIKLFEYMAASLPVICSDFPFWVEILEGYECGFIVDPMNINEINNAMQRLIDDPELALKMGREGRKLVEDKYNWDREAKKLIALYADLL
jgi:glycosyltransferase involved in cell wall biosynthesis